MVITSTYPTNNSINIYPTSTIYVDFDLDIDATSVDNSSITVSSNNASVVETKSTMKPNDVFAVDTFFKDGVTGFVDGVVTVAGKRLTFTPKKPLRANQRYTVSISSTIAGSNATTLGKIRVLYFTTAEADVNIEEIPVPDNLTTIIGSDIIENIAAPGVFSFLDIIPTNGVIIRTTTTFEMEFSEDVDPDSTEEGLKIYVYDIMSDIAVDKLTEGTDYTVTIVDGMVSISFTSGVLSSNKMLAIRLTTALRMLSDSVVFLSTAQEFRWLITPSQYYSSTKLLKLKAGTVLSAIEDLDLSFAIWNASIEADVNLANVTSANIDIVKQKYVLYTALENLLMNNFNYGLSDFVKKQLGDFNISLSNKHKVSLYNKLIDEIKHWKQVLNEYINLTSSTGYFSRGSANRSSDIGRLWTSGLTYPGLNSVDQSHERLLKTWDDMIEYTEV